MKNAKITVILTFVLLITQSVYSQKRTVKNYNIEYDYGIGISEINKIIENKDDFFAEILFEYKTSNTKSLIFVAINVAGDPNGIFVINKRMELNEIAEQVKALNMEIFHASFDETKIKIQKNKIIASDNFSTSMETQRIYKIIENKIIEIEQPYYNINKKTRANSKVYLYSDLNLKNKIGFIKIGENFTIQFAEFKSFNLGGKFLIITENGKTGWINIELNPNSDKNKPKLEGIYTYEW